MNKISKLVEAELLRRRKFAFSFAETNLQKARQNEEYKEFEKIEAEKKIQIATLIADNKIEEAKKEKEELEKINLKKTELLRKMGLDEKDVLPSFSCKLCNDTGKDNCKCRIEIKNKILLEKAGISANLETFSDAKIVNKEIEKTIEILKSWATQFPNVSKKNIFISGETGVGKTFLSHCVISELIKNGNYVYFSTAFNLNQTFIEYCTTKENNNLFEPLLESDVLVIDDLGTEPILKNITLNYLYLILNERSLKEKATIISSNLNMQDVLDRYGERIFSRIVDKRNGIAIKLLGDDLRIKK